MAKTPRSHAATLQGTDLIEQVIVRVRQDPMCLAGFCGDHPLKDPQPLPPEVVAQLTFPSGKPLPPSLRRWLTFDASWLQQFGWFSSLEPPIFTPRSIGAIAAAEFGADWETITTITGMEGDLNFYSPLDDRLPECFLLPEGSDSRRIFAVTAPDERGEYPVVVIDVDDLPYAAIMYPGFDVYLAHLERVMNLSGVAW